MTDKDGELVLDADNTVKQDLKKVLTAHGLNVKTTDIKINEETGRHLYNLEAMEIREHELDKFTE